MPLVLIYFPKDSKPARSFNVGAFIPDTEAIGPDGQSIAAWRQARGIDTSQKIRVVRLVHIRYQHSDLDTITTFLQDFGMHVVRKTEDGVWFRGYGVDQYVYYAQKDPKKFLGGIFEVETYEDLLKAARLEGASRVMSLDDAPGGGSLVTAYDAEGLPINLIHGQEPAETGKMPEKLLSTTRPISLGSQGFSASTKAQPQCTRYTRNFFSASLLSPPC